MFRVDNARRDELLISPGASAIVGRCCAATVGADRDNLVAAPIEDRLEAEDMVPTVPVVVGVVQRVAHLDEHLIESWTSCSGVPSSSPSWTSNGHR
jgi:hypothetical protein